MFSMRFLMFVGRTRDSTPPKPARLGLRVAHACAEAFAHNHSEHSLSWVDPLDYELNTPFKTLFA